MNILKSIRSIKPSNTRSIFASLNVIFNRVNEKRIKEVGPDRACAEWLMRNGAHIRWKGQQSLLTDYNLLPLDAKETGDYQIEEVSAKEASITHHGFDHFYGCHGVKIMKFENCWYFDDSCLERLHIVSNSLLHLEIIRCAEVTDAGLHFITRLKNLQSLGLQDLDAVKDIHKCASEISSALPHCQVSTKA